jgi:3-oxoacyl-[acyl-carrier-protein] synthase II
MTRRRQVVVTGLGAISPVGGDVPSTWAGLLAGKSGVRALIEDWAEVLPVRIAARVAVEPVDMMDRVGARRLDRSGQFAIIAAREAWRDAEKNAPIDVEPERLGAVVATGIGGITTLLANYDALLDKGPRRVSPHAIPMLMPNGPAATVGLEIGAKAGVHSPVSACASGSEAIGYGIEMIRSGRADVVLAGGTEAAIHPLTLAAFAAMRALSRRNDEPELASRPFDRGRDGFVMGEGAGIVVLECAEHAARRGARVYCVAAGVALSADSYDTVLPDPEGSGGARAIRSVLADAGLAADQIVHVNAHATGTPQGDVAEAKAIRAALGAATDSAAVSATKSTMGHLLGAAGAVESIATILALYERHAPPTLNLSDPDDVRLDIVRGEPRRLPAGDIAALNNSFGFGGHNVALAFHTRA